MTITRRGLLALGGGLTLGAAVSTPAAAETGGNWARLAVVTANIGRGSDAARHTSIRRVRTSVSAPLRPLVGWQEINEGDMGERDIIKSYFKDLYSAAYFWKDGNGNAISRPRVPIMVPAPWRIDAWRAHWVHGAVGGRTSPARRIIEAQVSHTRNPQLRFVILNTHYIANAYNGRNRKDLRGRWDLHFEKHRALVRKWHDRGRHVIWTGDVNRRVMPALHKGEQRVFSQGLDQIRWLPRVPGAIRLQGRRTVDLTVDGHDARVGIFRIRV